MKFEEQLIVVNLGDDEDKAVLTFQEPLENERLQIIELGRNNLRKALKIVYKNCIKVENLFIGDQEISAEDVNEGNVRGSVADAIAVGYYTALNPPQEDAEKKD